MNGTDEHVAGDLVVKRLAGPAVGAAGKHRAGGRRHVADRHHRERLFARLCADVKIQVVELNLAQLELRLIHHHAAHAVFEDDGLTDQIDRAQAAHGGKPQIARFLSVGHHHANFIHVGAEHHLFGALFAFFMHDQIAHHVARDLIGIRGDLALNELRKRLLVSADRQGFHHLFEEFHCFHLSPYNFLVKSSRPALPCTAGRGPVLSQCVALQHGAQQSGGLRGVA